MHISRLRHPRLTIEALTVKDGESWCFFGPSRSGINEFLALLEGCLDNWSADSFTVTDTPTIISFAVQQDIYEEELRNDDSDFLDRPDPGTPAQEFLPPGSLDHPLIDGFRMRDALTTGYRQLSSGQNRKLLLLKAILTGATTIVIDSPYDGLDPDSCRELDQALGQLASSEFSLLVLVRNPEDIPAWSDYLGIFDDGTLLDHGRPHDLVEQARAMAQGQKTILDDRSLSTEFNDKPVEVPGTLLQLTNGFSRYGDKRIFTGLDLSVVCGQHTLITGPNGCGKSTLLQIITGDNPMCYANDLTIFGQRRGTGESIWDLKRFMGLVSPELHRGYRVPGTALQVVLSGLFDSIGLYQKTTSTQQYLAKHWLAAVDLGSEENTPFRQLTYSDQRLVLIARALIKQPPLLILDEPTQGLDAGARRGLLDFLETVSRGEKTTILYVSHRRDEYRTFFRQHLHLEEYRPH